MRRSFITILLLFSLVAPWGITRSAHAATASNLTFNHTRLFYYQEGKLARESLFAHYKSIDVFAPMAYAFDTSGNLTGGVKPDVLEFVKSHHIKVMPLVTNGSFSPAVSSALLSDPTKQEAAIAALIAEAKKQGYWGWQFDFEQMDASSREQFSTFVHKAADEMRANDLTISVAIIAQISENPSDYPKDLWQKTIGVYDYQALASSTDFLSLMSYDDPYSKGPVVEYGWLKKVIDYSLRSIPHEKLSLGVPLYYWQWNDTTGKRIGIGGRKGIYNVFKNHRVTVHYSVEHETPYLTYWHRAKKYVLWYENERSIEKKMSLIKKYDLHGFSAWALGLELPTVYNAIKK